MEQVDLPRLAAKSGLALLTSCLLFANMIGRLTDPTYRLFLQPGSWYRAGLILDVILLAARLRRR